MEELENSEVFKLINHVLLCCFQIIKVIHAYNKDANNTEMWLLKSEKKITFRSPLHSLDLTTILTTDVYSTHPLTMAHEPKWAHYLFLDGPWAKNNFYVFKWLKRNKENKISLDIKFKFWCP